MTLPATFPATLPAAARLPLAGDLSICRILNGMWQVSGAHGAIDPARAVDAMFRYHDAGFTTWDLADHYGPAEDFVGDFRRRFAAERGAERLAEIQAFTKWVPPPGAMTRARSSRARSACRSGGWRSIASTSCSSTGGIIATGVISTRCSTSPICATRAGSATSR